MQFPPYTIAVIEKLTSAGFSAYAVGGCVRDSLLGRTPADWDITTSALPEETIRVFDCAPFSVRADNGLKHGTVTVILAENACEVTTFRTEGSYTDHRHPDTVTFVTRIEDDLSRRDFTVNAIAAAPTADGYTLIDPFGGRDDLESGILRCVGKPEKRLTEDALRILRGMGCAARYNFKIHPQTARDMHACAPLLKTIAPERIGDELRGILKAPHCGRILQDFSDIALQLLPGCAALRAETLFAHTNCPTVRLICLLADCPPGKAEEMLIRYGFGRTAAETAAAHLSLKDADLRKREVLCRIADTCGANGIDTYFAFRRALTPEDAALDTEEKAVRALFKPGVCYNVATLAVRGADLLYAGIAKGPAVGKILLTLTHRVIAGELSNTPAELIDAAKEIYCSGSDSASDFATSDSRFCLG